MGNPLKYLMKILKKLKKFSKKLRDDVTLFVSSEEASLAKHSVAALGAIVLGSGALSSVYAAVKHGNGLDKGTQYVYLQHQHHSTHSTHASHSTHSTHSTHANWCEDEQKGIIKIEAYNGFWAWDSDHITCDGIQLKDSEQCKALYGDAQIAHRTRIYEKDSVVCVTGKKDGWAGYDVEPCGYWFDGDFLLCKVLDTGEVLVNSEAWQNAKAHYYTEIYNTTDPAWQCCGASKEICENVCHGHWRS